MSQPDDLQRGIRQKILAGDLPKQDCRMTWYGGGTGGICVACDQPITADDVEVECDLPQGVRSDFIGGATTSGRRSGRRAREHDVHRVERVAEVNPSRPTGSAYRCPLKSVGTNDMALPVSWNDLKERVNSY